MADLLLISPDHDQLTHAMRQWAADLGYSVVQRGTHTWCALQGSDVTRANVESRLADRTAAVFFYGHGEADRLLANGANDAAVDSGNAGLLKGTLVFAVACDSARVLGPEAVKLGARAYVGYDYPMVVIWGPDEKSFRRAANAPLLASLRDRGTTCGTAVDQAKKEYESAAASIVWGPRRNDYDSMFAAGWLRSNAAALKVIGDATAGL